MAKSKWELIGEELAALDHYLGIANTSVLGVVARDVIRRRLAVIHRWIDEVRRQAKPNGLATILKHEMELEIGGVFWVLRRPDGTRSVSSREMTDCDVIEEWEQAIADLKAVVEIMDAHRAKGDDEHDQTGQGDEGGPGRGRSGTDGIGRAAQPIPGWGLERRDVRWDATEQRFYDVRIWRPPPGRRVSACTIEGAGDDVRSIDVYYEPERLVSHDCGTGDTNVVEVDPETRRVVGIVEVHAGQSISQIQTDGGGGDPADAVGRNPEDPVRGQHPETDRTGDPGDGGQP